MMLSAMIVGVMLAPSTNMFAWVKLSDTTLTQPDTEVAAGSYQENPYFLSVTPDSGTYTHTRNFRVTGDTRSNGPTWVSPYTPHDPTGTMTKMVSWPHSGTLIPPYHNYVMKTTFNVTGGTQVWIDTAQIPEGEFSRTVDKNVYLNTFEVMVDMRAPGEDPE